MSRKSTRPDDDSTFSELFIDSVRLKPDVSESAKRAYPLNCFAFGDGVLQLSSRVTFFVGDNGAGKSTVLEALAIASGFNAEGGTRNSRFETQRSNSDLYKALRVTRGLHRPATGFFLRAESFYNFATYMDDGANGRLSRDGQSLMDLYGDSYGGKSLHRQSHGESFLAVMINQFSRNGLYFLDEPEAALSVGGQLTLLRLLHEHVTAGVSQFIISTHSPILTAYPDAEIYQFADGAIEKTPYRETELYTLYKTFLNSDKMLSELLKDE